jgi:Rieske Fe-S protein
MDHRPNKSSRRLFLQVLPLGIIGSGLSILATAAFRFLRPVAAAASQNWIDIAPLASLSGSKPLLRKVTTENVQGWARTIEEHHVFILPAKQNQVLSAVCPHEGCEVAWQEDLNVFACPCHDSSFASDGTRLNGPSRRGLDPLPSRVENGTLQVQYQMFVNNTQERTTRG